MENWKTKLVTYWAKKIKKVEGNKKKIIKSEIKLLITGKFLLDANNQNWTSSVAELVISKLKDNKRYEQLNRTEYKIACPPCHVIDLKSGTVEKRKPENNWSWEITVPYVKEEDLDKEKVNYWIAKISDITLDDEEKADTLQIMLGSALTGIGYRRFFYFLYGEPSSGKSILFKIIRYIMGDFATQADKYIITNRKDKGPINSGIVRIRDKRLIYTPELEDDDSLDADYINRSIGGDSITGRNPFKGEIIYDPMSALFILANFTPNIKEHKLWVKLFLILLKAEFVQNPNPKIKTQRKIDRKFGDKIIKDTELMKVILYWLVEGAMRFIENENYIPISKESANFIGKLKYIDDNLGKFIREYFQTPEIEKEMKLREELMLELNIKDNAYNPELEELLTKTMDEWRENREIEKEVPYKIKTTDFHQLYRDFLEKENLDNKISGKRIVQDMRRKGFIKRDGTYDYYLNIDLRPEFKGKKIL
jgi:phage/plasmid-associated DNA primase